MNLEDLIALSLAVDTVDDLGKVLGENITRFYNNEIDGYLLMLLCNNATSSFIRGMIRSIESGRDLREITKISTN